MTPVVHVQGLLRMVCRHTRQARPSITGALLSNFHVPRISLQAFLLEALHLGKRSHERWSWPGGSASRWGTRNKHKPRTDSGVSVTADSGDLLNRTGFIHGRWIPQYVKAWLHVAEQSIEPEKVEENVSSLGICS